MCLTKLEDFELKSDIGYKTFSKKDGRYYSFKFGTLFHIGKTKEDQNDEMLECGILERMGGKYRTGFHLFANKEGAEKLREFIKIIYKDLVICKVRFEDVVAKGKMEEGDLKLEKCIVARKIEILGEV